MRRWVVNQAIDLFALCELFGWERALCVAADQTTPQRVRIATALAPRRSDARGVFRKRSRVRRNAAGQIAAKHLLQGANLEMGNRMETWQTD